MDWLAVVGGNIKRLRKARDLTQEAVAFDAEVSTDYLGKVERGQRNPTLKLLIRICAALETEPVELFQKGKKK